MSLQKRMYPHVICKYKRRQGNRKSCMIIWFENILLYIWQSIISALKKKRYLWYWCSVPGMICKAIQPPPPPKKTKTNAFKKKGKRKKEVNDVLFHFCVKVIILQVLLLKLSSFICERQPMHILYKSSMRTFKLRTHIAKSLCLDFGPLLFFYVQQFPRPCQGSTFVYISTNSYVNVPG